MTNCPALIGSLADAGVEYIVVGGAAATAHGSARLTLDLDVVYRRTPDNIARVAESVARHQTPLVSSSLGRHLAYFFRATNSRCQFCTTDTLETALILPSGMAAIPR